MVRYVWWAVRLGGSRVHTIQAISRTEDLWVCKAQTQLMGVCDNRTSAVKLLTSMQEKVDFIDVVYDEIKEDSRRKMRPTLIQFITADHNKTLISIKLRDQRCDERNDGLQVRQRDLPAEYNKRRSRSAHFQSRGMNDTESIRRLHKDQWNQGRSAFGRLGLKCFVIGLSDTVHSARRWRRWTSRKLENERTQLDEKTDKDQKCFVQRSQERIYGRDPLGHHSREILWQRPYGRDHSTETIRETIRERPCGRTRRETTTADHSGDHTGYHDWRLQEFTENGFWNRPDVHPP